MLKFSLEDAKMFVLLLGAAKEIVSEAVFKADEDGLSLRALDDAKVAMVDISLPSQFFYEYACTGETTIGVMLDEVLKILKRSGKKNRQITVEVPDEDNVLQVTITGDGRRVFRFPLVDIEYTEVPEPKIPFSASLKIATKTIYSAIKEMEAFYDTVYFKATPRELTIYTESERGRAETIFTEDDLIELEVDGDEASASYSVDYLLKMLKHDDLQEIVDIKFGNDVPMMVGYTIQLTGSLKYLLAPRMG